jgi:urease accessory protein
LNILPLLQLCDSLFPVGAFAYSDGLEAAAGDMKNAGEDLAAWLDVCLDETVGRLEGPAVWQAWAAFDASDWDTLATLNRDAIALRPSSSGRQSTRAMALRLLTMWSDLHREPRLEHLVAIARRGDPAPTLPVAFAAACASVGIGRREAVDGYAYTRLSGATSAAMRVLPIGQREAHAVLARILDRVPAVIEAIANSDRPLESFSPLMDIAAMSQQYLHSRLFRS